MKKLISLSLAVIMMFSMAVSVFAAENENITPLLNRDLKITYNGNFQTFTDVNGNIVYPLSYNDTTYLPVRAVSSLVNLPIAWDGANYTVVLGGDAEVPVPAEPVGTPVTGKENVPALLNKALNVTYNGELQTFKDANGVVVYPISYNDTTYLPVRAISELIGLYITFDGATYSVVIMDEKPEQPVAPPAAEPSKLTGGSWNGNIYTNEFANVKYTADDNSLVYTQEYIDENIGLSTDEIIVDFLVADVTNQVVAAIRYEDISQLLADNGWVDGDITSDILAEAYAISLAEKGTGFHLGFETVTLNGVEYSLVKIQNTSDEIEYAYYRVFDGHYVTTISLLGYDEASISAAEACFN